MTQNPYEGGDCSGHGCGGLRFWEKETLKSVGQFGARDLLGARREPRRQRRRPNISLPAVRESVSQQSARRGSDGSAATLTPDSDGDNDVRFVIRAGVLGERHIGIVGFLGHNRLFHRRLLRRDLLLDRASFGRRDGLLRNRATTALLLGWTYMQHIHVHMQGRKIQKTEGETTQTQN